MNNLKTYRRIEQDVVAHDLKNALDKLRALINISKRAELMQELDDLDTIYRNMLQYFIRSVKDPHRNEVYENLRVSVLELTDIAIQSKVSPSKNPFLIRKRNFETEMGIDASDLYSSLNRLFFDEELEKIINSEIKFGLEADRETESRKKLVSYIFLNLWFTDKLKEGEANLAEFVRKSETFTWYEKCLIVSAVTMSLIRCFDTRKFRLLQEFSNDPEPELKHRAYTGLFAGLMYYNSRIALHPETREILASFKFEPDVEVNLNHFLLQVLKSLETETINKKLKDEILDEVEKIKPRLTDKLELENLLQGEFGEDRNPDWEKFFEGSSDLFEKLQEMSQLQLDGNDVFMSAFENLKSFFFFNEPANWFLPFYTDNPEMTSILASENAEESGAFFEALNKSFFICNSDKHSFCLNMQSMPHEQRQIISRLFISELEQMAELSEEENILNSPVVTRSIYSRYIQDLYRFFKLHPDRQFFGNIFDEFRDFHNSLLIMSMDGNIGILKSISAYLFEKDHFDKAFEIFRYILNNAGPEQELFEKMGFCCQKSGLYQEAIDYYKKAELFEPDKPWILKKTAYCLRKLQHYEEALQVNLRLLKNDPENLYLHTQAGHCNLDLKKYEEALNHYFRVEFLDTGNIKVCRPIAWCLLMTSKFENAIRYYKIITDSGTESNFYDFMNLGHAEWCNGSLDNAAESYARSLSQTNNEEFFNAFNDDIPMLEKNGIDKNEIRLVLDYLKYKL